ncbi:hypothetical protein BGX24_003633 [Mortierella sp. AD032]|nr:hypothetical protein BGX24_003633 [Mortierella sp. AD032]
MKIPRSVLAAVAALLVASASSAQQDPLEMTNNNVADEASVEPQIADSVGFLNAGRGRLVSITGTEYETLERGEWPDTMSTPSEQVDPEGIEATAVGTAVTLSQAEIQSILDTHNKYRKMHGVPDVTWNAEAAKFGDNYLQPCAFKHSGGKYGENLAAGQKDFPAAIKAWYDEVSKYNFKLPGFSGGTGHFTQVVWKNTKTIGCARRACPTWPIYICEYDPPGNIVNPGYFKDNVLPIPPKAP